MNVCRFLNSKDLASYLREIRYEFSLPEAAFIVERSRLASLEEKVAAWRELADTMPDCGMRERQNMDRIPSFKQFLHDYMALKEQEISHFYEPEGCVYCSDYGGGGYGDKLFSSAQDCIEYLSANLDGANEGASLEIVKCPISKSKAPVGGRLYLNRHMQVMGVTVYGETDDEQQLSIQFEGMWFAFPTPFKRGDIVRDASSDGSHAYVLSCLCTWNRAECLSNGLPQQCWNVKNADRMLDIHRKDGDTSDLWWSAYGMGKDGLWLDDMGSSYLDVERCADNLNEANQWAYVVSALIKGEIRYDEAEKLLRYLEKRNEAFRLRAQLEDEYPKQFYPDHPWQKIRHI